MDDFIISKVIELNKRDNSLNLLRLIFALFVLIAHSYLIGSYKHNIPEQAFYFLDLAVPMFFVVLGYLITASAISNDLKSYALKRFARIYPGYLVSMILVLVLFAPIAYSIVFNGFNLTNYLSLDPSPANFILNAAYFNIWLPIGNILNNFAFQTWNDSTWTLLHEVFCYIIIGVSLPY